MLTRDEILAGAVALRLVREKVNVPELGGTVIVRELTAAEAERLDAANYPLDAEGRMRPRHEGQAARWVIAATCDADGKLLFTAADEAAIGRLPAAVVDRIVAVARRLSRAEPGGAEAAAKN
jgi:hypothetical protein